MQLTPLQLEIQQRANKTLSFGILVGYLCSSDEEGGFAYEYERAVRIGTYSEKKDPTNMKFVCDLRNGVTVRENDYDKIIGHPMNRGRLCYIAGNHNMNTPKEWYDVQTFLLMFPSCYQKTVLERPVELQEFVLKFLLTLPKDE